MTDKPQGKNPDPKMDATTLYREEVFTDRKVGTIRRLTPVKSDGSTDTARATVYVGEAQILTPMGALPINFELPAKSLDEAIAQFGPATKEAVDRTMQELQELRRQASSSIVIPERGATPPIGPAGLPGGGKIKLP